MNKLKHAIMVIGHGENASILQSTINILDSVDIDFFVHWDRKYKMPLLKSNKSSIFIVENPIDVKWGTDSQIKVEKLLFNMVQRNKKKYDYAHLISSVDMPLMTKEYFLNYFKKDMYVGFVSSIDDKLYRRLAWYYPNKFDFKTKAGKVIHKCFEGMNYILRVNRIKENKKFVEKGCNWFSISTKYLDSLCNYDKDYIFEHTFCADEFYVQTILHNYKPSELYDDNKMAARYIDWKRGRPYTFHNCKDDINELRRKLNTRYAFARKIGSADIIDKVFYLDN